MSGEANDFGLGLQRMDTSMQMDQAADQSIPLCGQMCCGLVFSMWIPYVFLTAAANVSEECENHDMATWFQADVGVTYVMPAVVYLIILIGANLKIPCFFKMGPKLQISTAIAGLIMSVWGWVIISSCTEEKCTKDHEAFFNPYSIMKILLIIQIIFAAMACCCMSMGVCMAIGMVASGAREGAADDMESGSASE
jgi:hypothetical protein